MKPMYFDYMATTPVDPRVADVMAHYLTQEGAFGNPASTTHAYGWEALAAVDHARTQLAALIQADPETIVWTSGATEANNLAIQGVAHAYRHRGNHIVTCRTEHKSVLDTCAFLTKQGFEVTYLTPNSDGLIEPDVLKQALKPTTILVSLMHANNEIGVIHDLQTLGAIVKQHRIIMHSDAAQSLGKVSIDVTQLPVDLLSFSGHKIDGPKGIGALYVRQRPLVRLQALMWGGGHERGLRSGTLPTHQIAGMGKACEILQSEMDTEVYRVRCLRDRLWAGIRDIPLIYLNGVIEPRLPGNLNVSVAFVEGESLLLGIPELALSSGSACNAATLEPSYVIKALGRRDELAYNVIRFGIGRFTTEAEIEIAILAIRYGIQRLRAISPLWLTYCQEHGINDAV